ncbi:hypothetical protein SCAR479_03536 [Seiridium cardinale]|uniref:Uncharacterized protein n=1 Tax=Seiridium cardinale TaxID=138064 RepID=A0ABR2Y113_9PEZI
MLLYLYKHSFAATITPELDPSTKMPPSLQPCSVVFDYRGQIIQNCEFISSQDDSISIITVKEPSGGWKVIVVRLNDDARDALLSSDPCDSLQMAIESLHAKSAEAASVYIKTNGFDLLRDPTKEDDAMSDDGTASVASDRSAASSVALSVWTSSDDELVTRASSSSKAYRVSSKPSQKDRIRNKAKHAPKYESESSDNDKLADAVPIRRVSVSPPRQPGSQHGPPPPPGWTGPPPPPGPTYRGPGPMPVHKPPPQPITNPNAPGPIRAIDPRFAVRLFDVRITIKWLHHSEQRIFESSRASIRALQDTALSYVRRHMDAFENVTPLDHSPNKLWTLRATVKQAFFGTEAYDMSGYRGDDLTKLFSVVGKNDIPRFEIEVDYVRPGGMPPIIVPVNGPAMP